MSQLDSVQELRRRQHAEIRAEVDKRLLQNADNFDKAILTYSSAGLALSLGFLKDFVSIECSVLPWLLYSSWALFVTSVVTTIGSYITSQFAQRRELKKSWLYNIEMKDEAFDLPNLPAKLTELASYVAGLCFILALVASTFFVALNLPKGSQMSKKNAGPIIGSSSEVSTSQRVIREEIKRGAPVPTMQSIPQYSPPAIQPLPISTPVSTGSNQGSGK